MLNPTHKVKRYVVSNDGTPPYWYEDTAVGWLATGIRDNNGVGIFEGDKVIFGELEKEGVVVFKDAMFQIAYTEHGREFFCTIGNRLDFVPVKVVGHIAEEEPS